MGGIWMGLLKLCNLVHTCLKRRGALADPTHPKGSWIRAACRVVCEDSSSKKCIYTDRHGIELFLHDSVDLLSRPIRILQWEGVQEQGRRISSHVDIGHFEGAPEERVVETVEHLRDRHLTPLLMDVAQELHVKTEYHRLGNFRR